MQRREWYVERPAACTVATLAALVLHPAHHPEVAARGALDWGELAQAGELPYAGLALAFVANAAAHPEAPWVSSARVPPVPAQDGLPAL